MMSPVISRERTIDPSLCGPGSSPSLRHTAFPTHTPPHLPQLISSVTSATSLNPLACLLHCSNQKPSGLRNSGASCIALQDIPVIHVRVKVHHFIYGIPKHTVLVTGSQ